MTTRERIEAEIDRLEKCRDVYMAYEAAFDAYNEGIGALEAILADLPAETPPTLEEFRQSGEIFINMDNNSGVYLYRFKSPSDDDLWDVGNYTRVINNADSAFIARMPRFYPVEGE